MNISTSSSTLDAFRASLENRIRSLSRGRGIFALADQVMVSGLNFITGIILVRALGLTDFGKYAIAYSILLYANSLQLSFVAAPMLSIAPLQEPDRRDPFLEGMYALQVVSSIFLLVTFLIAGLVATIFTNVFTISSIVALSCCVGTYELQDWLRRYYFLKKRGISALITDAISYLGQVILLLLLWQFHKLNLDMALIVIAVTSLLGFSMGPVYDRLKLRLQHLRMAWRECKAMGRDLIVANQARWFGFQGVLLIAADVVGPRSIGGLRATQNMTGPMNLALLSIENVVPAKLSEEIFERGADSAYRVTKRAAIAILKCSVLMIPVIIFGRQILRFLYGPATVPFYSAMILQIGDYLLMAVGRMLFYFFRSVQETRIMLIANIASATVSVGAVFPLGKAFGPFGVILASVAGQLIIIGVSLFHWRIHRTRILAQNPPRSAVARAAALDCCASLESDLETAAE